MDLALNDNFFAKETKATKNITKLNDKVIGLKEKVIVKSKLMVSGC